LGRKAFVRSRTRRRTHIVASLELVACMVAGGVRGQEYDMALLEVTIWRTKWKKHELAKKRVIG